MHTFNEQMTISDVKEKHKLLSLGSVGLSLAAVCSSRLGGGAAQAGQALSGRTVVCS